MQPQFTLATFLFSTFQFLGGYYAIYISVVKTFRKLIKQIFI